MTREPTIRAVRFGRCVVDLRRRLLWRDGRPVALTAKTFDVLAFLLERPNRVVEKEEFFTHVWPGTSVLEASLVRQISLLRKALGQRPDHHEYIVTIPGRGYELVAVPEPMATLPDDIGAQTGSAVTAPAGAGHDPIVASRRDEARHGRSGTVLNGFLGIGLIVAVVVVGTRWWTSTHVNTPRTLIRVTFESGSPRETSWSPDGNWISITTDA
jgi:DNA-binding winged helix-turn-helix (wHTH) protein